MPAHGVETIEQRSARLEQEVITADGAWDLARRNLAKALETMVTAEQLRASARANYRQHQYGVIGDALHDVVRLRLPQRG